jgi:acyl-coenzyme A synthetase/AMP-(fatty) acid ligase
MQVINPLRSSFLKLSKLMMMEQRRKLHYDINNFHPNIGEIYNRLLNMTTDGPISCNFITQVVDQWAEKSSEIAIRCIDQDNSNHSENITYAHLVRRSNQIANFFEKKGIKKGDAVALMLGQRPIWWYSIAGLIRRGIAVVPCSRLLTPNDLLYRINDLGIRSIITTPELQDRVNLIRDKCPSLINSVTTGSTGLNWDSLIDIFNDFGENTENVSKIDTTTADPCLYLYTSGTTGQPKAVMHNQDYPFFHWPTGRRWLQATPQDLVYNASDTGWGFTVWITMAVWSMGAKLLITPTNKKFDPQKMLATLESQPITIFCAAPTVLRLLAAETNFNRYHFPTLKRIVTVGEALDETVINRFASRGIEVAVGFGQAETPLLIGRVDDQPHVPGTMGKPIAPYQVAVLDDNLQPLSPGSIGQIAVDLIEGKRNGLMRGYANAPEKTQKAFSPDGRYYLTGDWAEYRHDDFLSYHGRKDDLIKSRGYRIGPDEVEKAGMSHPAVAKIAVVGVPTEYGSLNHTVKAFILLKANYIETPELIKDIQEHIKRETAAHKYPRLVECLSLGEWEKYETTSGKIRRAALRKRDEDKLASSHAAKTGELIQPPSLGH